MRLDHALLARFGEHVHGALFPLRPIGVQHTVQQNDIDVVSADFAAVAVELRPHLLLGGGAGLGHDGDLLAGDALQRFL